MGLWGQERKSHFPATPSIRAVYRQSPRRIFQNIKFREKGGARGRIRTTDTAIFSRLLYQLSYSGICAGAMRWRR